MSQANANALGNILIVGGGRMGQAIASGLLDSGIVSKSDVVVANPGAGKRAAIEESLGIRTVPDAASGLPASCVILAVKPAKIPDAIMSLVSGGIDERTLVVSIAAGVSTASISEQLKGAQPVVRVMPNTPLVCGHGMSAVSGGAHASQSDCELVRSLFASMGSAVVVSEDQQDAVCAVSGSGPAYFELFCELISRTAESLGLDYELALKLTLQTMLGTAVLIRDTGQSLEDAIDAVCSPGGTTIAALDAMREAGLEQAVGSGVEAAYRRSKELGS